MQRFDSRCSTVSERGTTVFDDFCRETRVSCSPPRDVETAFAALDQGVWRSPNRSSLKREGLRNSKAKACASSALLSYGYCGRFARRRVGVLNSGALLLTHPMEDM